MVFILSKALRMVFKFNLSCRKSWFGFALSLCLMAASSPSFAQIDAETSVSADKKPAAAATNAKPKKTNSKTKSTKNKAAPAGTPQGNRSVADATNKPTTKSNNSNSIFPCHVLNLANFVLNCSILSVWKANLKHKFRTCWVRNSGPIISLLTS
jgi:hypothetical protein